ncbi:hypothetical protein Arub01_51510 [Actinomadura rubrobrunea]|uniref:Major facilitator superfamily (MFS) profile domain-containing protein n=1 Tax=Actinomadura rubrobrunea TaxID=115335 RepID=A0A9W6PZQ9_9ACTN|nr:MDR family MFS transporter [Actinomadura rubrobrunea]GLW66907.1 hypothetical protein Arub01_51510 [Actinomadura rubrobrunea]
MTSDVTIGTGATRGHVALASAGLSLGVLLSVLDQTVVATALPEIAADVGGLGSIGWVATAYLLASTATGALYGRISDRFGRRATFLAAVGVFTAASALCATADTLGLLIAFRALQGIGAGGLFVLPSIALSELFPAEQRGKVQGYLGAVFAVGSVGGPLVGGVLTDRLSWRWIFYVNIPLGLLAILLTATALRLPAGARRTRLDLPGSALVVAAVVAVMLAIEWGGRDHAWGSATILGLLAAAVVLFAAFVWWERRSPDPVLPLRLMAGPVLRIAVPAAVLLGALLYGSVFFLPTYFQHAHGMTATEAGFALIPFVGAFVVASGASGRLASSLGRHKPFIVAGAVVMTAGIGLLGRLGDGASYGLVAAETVVLGLGVGLIMQLLVTIAQNAVPPADLAATTSLIMSTRGLGTALGVAFFGALLDRSLDAHKPVATAIPDMFAWAVPVAVLLFVLTVVLPERKADTTAPTAEPTT